MKRASAVDVSVHLVVNHHLLLVGHSAAVNYQDSLFFPKNFAGHLYIFIAWLIRPFYSIN